jgi:ubiquinone/menaquinone biosynthesis C-methylase UbiE
MQKPWFLRKEYVESYEQYYETKYKRADILEKEVLKEAILKLGDGKSILEVGCGTCHFTRWFESLGYYAVGVDISILMLKESKKYWKGDIIQGDSHYLPIRDKFFDYVAFITCLEYMKEPHNVIKEAERVAKKGIILGLMNSWSLPTLRRRIQIALGKNPFYIDTNFYSILSIKKIIKRALKKFKIIYSNSTVFPRIFGKLKSRRFPFGAFLCIAIQLENK